MSVLVYGAGPLGSIFASRLQQSGHQVTLLARGQRLADLQEHGIVLEDALTGRRTVANVALVERLVPDDAYDLVLVVMRKNKVGAVLPSLEANRHTPNVCFLMNNAAGPGEFVAALGPERVLMGFPMSAGLFDGYVVRCLTGSEEHPVVIPIGEVDGRITERTYDVACVLSSMPGYQVEMRTDMDAWLKTHVALLMPSIAAALYACGADRERMVRTRDALVLATRAAREGFRVLRALGVPIVPQRLQRLERLPEPLLVAFVRRLLAQEVMDVALVGHAKAARDEVACLAAEFRALARSSAVPTPAMDRLARYLNPTTPLLPDGSAEISLDLRGVWLLLGVLAGLVGVGLGLARLLRRRR